MSEVNLNYFIYNGKIYKSEEFERVYVEDSSSVYEVLRVNKSIPVFLEEHYERLLNSGKIIGYDINLSFKGLRHQISSLIEKNNVIDHNIKIVINNLNTKKPNIYIFFIKTSYPDNSLYIEGVKTFIYNAQRDNPNAKIINTNLRSTINALLKEKDCFEAILINSDGYITEGSRSNLFFIKDNTLYTPKGENVLLGITRRKIIELSNKNNIEVKEEHIHVNSLKVFSAIFISGTSPKVLPICKVDNLQFDTKESLLLKIMDIYNREISDYLAKNK